ncbi:MAG: TatD family hydrolase [Methanobrevibacter sp.]|jgi:predicted metal-dependent TIM-barrel fold hydrolase|nr:TatD family hydrolase [Methanobrevibacter sp.]
MIDSHFHGDSRSIEDYKKMSISGVKEIISCAYYPYKFSDPSVLLTHFKRISEFETERAKKEGIKLHVALGIHPTNIFPKYQPVLDELKRLIDEKKIVAVGEIGLEESKEEEIDIFKKQLYMADYRNAKVVVHTPRKDKLATIKKIKEILSENINPRLVVIDHINPNVIDEVIDEGYKLGLTVQPEKMTPDEAVKLIEEYGVDKFMLNSDCSYSKSDVLSVPKTVRKLRMAGFKEEDIEKVSNLNAKKFFNLKKFNK